MQRLPSLKQLEYLCALVENEHFGKAAERCHVTVSTLSAGIRELEAALGAAVAERSKRRVLITPLGRELAQRSRQLLRDAADLMALARTRHAPLTGTLRMGVIPTVGPFLLPRVLSGLRTHFPALRLALDESLTQTLLDRLRSGELDLALLALPFGTGELTTAMLCEDSFVFACSQTHRYARRHQVSVAELADEPLMLLEEGHCLRTHALEACKLHDRAGRSQFEASSFHTLVQMVSSGIGVTLLPQIAVDAHIADGMDTALVPLKEPASRQIALAWRRASPRDAEFRQLAAAMRSLLSST